MIKYFIHAFFATCNSCLLRECQLRDYFYVVKLYRKEKLTTRLLHSRSELVLLHTQGTGLCFYDQNFHILFLLAHRF